MADANDDENKNEQQMIDKARKFLQNGCGWSRGVKGGPCSDQFSKETVLANLNNCLQLSNAQLDLVILANIQACTRIENIGEKEMAVPDATSCINQYLSAGICFWSFTG